MGIKIIADSCCDLSPELKQETGAKLVPLTLQIGDEFFKDDENLDIYQYIDKMVNSPVSPKTACPSPQDFINYFEGTDDILCVTISKELSGTYQSAMIAKDIFLEDHPDRKIHIFDSKSASAGQTLIVLKIHEFIQQGKSFEEIVMAIESFINEMETFFLLESLENLAKSGRLNPILAKVAKFLSIKVIAKEENGAIALDQKVRGYKKAFQRLIDSIEKYGKNLDNKTLVISHCNCEERAETFKREVEARYPFKDIRIVQMGGVASGYADQGGIVIAY